MGAEKNERTKEEREGGGGAPSSARKSKTVLEVNEQLVRD